MSSIQDTKKWGDSSETRGNKSSLLGHLGSGPGTSGTSPNLGSPAEALFTGLPGKKLTGQDKNWSNRINKDGGWVGA